MVIWHGYTSSGSSEGEARQAAFLNAFTKLSRLFSASGTPGALGVVDDRLTTLLKMAGQAEPVYSLKAQRYKASIQLKFSGYRLENKSTTNKKQARNYLSAHILKMLGVDTGEPTAQLAFEIIKFRYSCSQKCLCVFVNVVLRYQIQYRT